MLSFIYKRNKLKNKNSAEEKKEREIESVDA